MVFLIPFAVSVSGLVGTASFVSSAPACSNELWKPHAKAAGSQMDWRSDEYTLRPSGHCVRKTRTAFFTALVGAP